MPPLTAWSCRILWNNNNKSHVLVVQNNGKEMSKKVYCTCKVVVIVGFFFLLIRSIVFLSPSLCRRRLELYNFNFWF